MLSRCGTVMWPGAFIVVFAAYALSGCSPGESQFALKGVGTPMLPTVLRSAASPIKHIVFIVQEGRTFENIFAGWPGAYAPLEGELHTGSIVPLTTMTYAQDREINTQFMSAKLVWHGGQLNYFDINIFGQGDKGPPVGRYVYAYLERKQVAPYVWLAKNYVLADHMFPTEWGSSFTAHLDLVAGSTFINSITAVAGDPSKAPWGCNAPRGTLVPVEQYGFVLPRSKWVRPCFNKFPTIADTLDHAHVPWTYYVSSRKDDESGRRWSVFDAIKNVRYGSDWKRDIKSPVTSVLQDAKNGQLPAVSWVIPKIAWSDGPSQKSDEGPSWVADVVNAVGKGPDWSSTVIVVVWSQWGGWFDNDAMELPNSLMLSGYGIRVPCLIVSPYAPRGVVSHTRYNFGSLLRFIEEAFGLPPLSSTGKGYVFTDDASPSISDALNLKQPPRPFVVVPAKYPPSHFRP